MRGKDKLAVVTRTLNYDEKIIILNTEDAKKLEIKSGDKVVLTNVNNASLKAIFTVATSSDMIDEGAILIPKNLAEKLSLKDGNLVKISQTHKPESIELIKKKMAGEKLERAEIQTIVNEIVSGLLGKTEIMGFVMAQKYAGMDMDEIESLTRAIAESGESIEFKRPTYDKHSIGGVPGNKVSLLIVPIIASAGLLIPKTSSRAITSPSGTADTMEVLTNVNLTLEEFVEVANKVGGALIWGGALNLAPADDIIINIEKTLRIDPIPQMLASIMAKKMAAGIKTMVLDVPIGKETKMESIDDAINFARLVIELGNRLGIRVQAGITYGEQPVGHNVGPALEAKEALEALIDPKSAPASLVEKSCSLAGLLLEMSGKAPIGMGHKVAKDILYSGKAYQKMKEIIEAQGGDPDIKPSEIEIGQYKYEVYAPVDGFVTKVSNSSINQIARAAGAPKEKGAGIILHVKRGRKVVAGQKILEIYAERSVKLQDAIHVLESKPPVIIEGMLLKTVPERTIYQFPQESYSQGSSSE